jgi:CheY-like chemotaxis protein
MAFYCRRAPLPLRIVNLLIVEENGAMCRLVRALIEGLPVAISECIDGAQSLAACAEALPDWVLIDRSSTATTGVPRVLPLGGSSPQCCQVVRRSRRRG